MTRHLPQAGARMDLGIMFAHTCNIACRHCGILSSPQNKEKMPIEDALRFIEEAAALRPLIQTIAFTGGEPLLFQDEHARMFARCRELGLSSRVVTNGFWASTMPKGLEVLGRMKAAGLDELNFSADLWHLEFQPASTLRNALECARQLGYTRIVSFVFNRDDAPPIDQFSALYGVPREDLALLDRETFEAIYADPARNHELLDKVFLSVGHLIGLGRAAEYPEDILHRPVDAYTGAGCSEIGNRPVIYPDGDLQACCCAGGKIEAFTVGNMHRSSLKDLIARMRGRSEYHFINNFGPKDMYKAVRAARPDVKRRLTYSSLCEMCVRAHDGVTAEEMDSLLEHETMNRMMGFFAGGEG